MKTPIRMFRMSPNFSPIHASTMEHKCPGRASPARRSTVVGRFRRRANAVPTISVNANGMEKCTPTERRFSILKRPVVCATVKVENYHAARYLATNDTIVSPSLYQADVAQNMTTVLLLKTPTSQNPPHLWPSPAN